MLALFRLHWKMRHRTSCHSAGTRAKRDAATHGGERRDVHCLHFEVAFQEDGHWSSKRNPVGHLEARDLDGVQLHLC